ncbi:MAG: NAD-dependent protein deacylase [Clostridia bacterium]|nr:NAD-dependent protein deacylase [Clostridia bacterium]
MNTSIDIFQTLVNRAKRIVFFGGAGVSTASGIPDFRGEEGLFQREYDGLTAEMMLSESFFYLHPERFFQFYRAHMLHPNAQPNAAHRKLMELERTGKLRGIVTQNIDGLHRAAGNRLVYEIHGSVHQNYCMDCNQFYPMEKVLHSKGIPRCDYCGGIVKPWVTLYGEPLDAPTETGACREISNCDLLIVAGTSLNVEPAASFLNYFHGRALVVINREETPVDERATLCIRGDIAQVMDALRLE